MQFTKSILLTGIYHVSIGKVNSLGMVFIKVYKQALHEMSLAHENGTEYEQRLYSSFIHAIKAIDKYSGPIVKT